MSGIDGGNTTPPSRSKAPMRALSAWVAMPFQVALEPSRASPPATARGRDAVAMRRAAQARALVDGRDFCIPEDVRDLAVDVFAHRITVDPRSHHSRDGEETSWIVREILETLPVPL